MGINTLYDNKEVHVLDMFYVANLYLVE